ncbi:rolling circle replication-associated protein [Aliivibrio fischeri]|uniref:rolling circle replication-associated protein n=1 Tax=Aliivibrio fischeri TaxID=668 RepID=UPI0012DAAA32|nr:hypothetical protein [Aliivibrio fischeri]MUJ36028.1 hypothetical protein [Aliivibrio fischeri]
MKTETLYHVAGSVRPINEVKEAQACYEAGFLGSKFYQSGFLGANSQRDIANENLKFRREEQLHYLATKHNREAAALAQKDIGLSKGAKVGHDKEPFRLQKIQSALRIISHPTGRKLKIDSLEAHDNFHSMYATTEQSKSRILALKHEKIPPFELNLSPVSLQIQKRDWSGQYRAQLVTQTPSSSAPDANTGTRFTEKLTPSSVSKVFESGAYVAQCHEGFSTFITLTFNEAQRLAVFGGMTLGNDEDGPYSPVEFKRDRGQIVYAKDAPYTQLPRQPFRVIKSIDTTMGKEVSRFLSGAKKMYQRGWVTSEGEKIPAHYKAKLSPFGPDREKADFHYLWVAECPANENGEPNPHVHLIMQWTVSPDFFQDWAMRLENLWGHGIAHIERIRQPKAASSYLIKAIGYAVKGANAEQGLIKGNRYSIAKCSRAPAWETLATFEADNITAIIKELGYKLEQWKKPLQRSLYRINKKKEQTIVAKSIATKANKPSDNLNKLQGRIIRLEHAARSISQKIKSKQMHASTKNRFSFVVEGEHARERMDNFLCWAAGARGWSMSCRDVDCSDIKQEANDYYNEHYKRFLEKRAYWSDVLNNSPQMKEVSEEEINYWQTVKANYLDGIAI